MRRIVYKYPVGVIPFDQALNIPSWNPTDDEPSRILKIGLDGSNEICVWVEHPFPFRGSTNNIQLMCFGTGHDFDNYSALLYVDTVVDRTGYVWHYYEVK